MMKERTVYLINAELDGVLESGEQAELEAILESSPEARAMWTELRKLVNLLDNMPEQAPPVGLTERIIGQLPAAAKRPSFSLPRIFPLIQPAPAAAAFAAGLLLAVGFYELSPRERPPADISNMVGTMVAQRQGPEAVRRDRIELLAPDVSGSVTLGLTGEVFVLDFELDATGQTEVVIAMEDAGLGFAGIAQAAAGSGAGQSYEVSGGALRVESEGRQAFSVFLLETVKRDNRETEISIGVASAGQSVFSGVLRG